MSNLRYEAWSPPGVTPHVRRVANLQPAEATGSIRADGNGSGTMIIPPDRIAEIVDADPAAPANDIASMIKVYRGVTLLHEWLVDTPPDETQTDLPVRLAGPEIDAVLRSENVEAWDWDGNATWQSITPDWIYGNPTAAGTFTNGGFEDATDGFGGNGGGENGLSTPWVANPTSGFLVAPKGGPDVTTTSPIRNGTYAIIFSATGPKSGIQANFDTVPGGNYTVTVWLNDPAISGERYRLAVKVEAGYVDNSSNGTIENSYIWVELDNTASAGATDGTWQSFVIDFDAGTLQTRSQMILVYDDTGAPTFGNIHVDDVSIAGPLVGLAPWEPITNPDIVTNVFRLETTIKRTGDASLAVQLVDSGAQNGGARQRVTGLTVGATYTFEAWVYQASGVAHDFKAVIKRPAGFRAVDGATVSVPTATWTKVAVTGQVDTSEVWLDVRWADTGTSPTFYIDDTFFYRGLAATTTGDIWEQLIADAQARNALLFLNETYTDLLDSNGDAWDTNDLSITIKMGQTYAQVRNQFEDRGYEYSITPTAGTPGEWDLNIYNPQGRGTDHTTDDTPSLVIGQGWIRGPVAASPPQANAIIVQGADGWTSRATDTNSISSDAGRRTRYIGDLRIPDGTAAAQLAASRLAEELASTVATAIQIVEPDSTEYPRPAQDYVLGDTLNVAIPGRTKFARRLRQLDYTHTTVDGAVWTVITGDPWTAYVASPTRNTPGGGGGVGGSGKPFGPEETQRELGALGESVNALIRRFAGLQDRDIPPVTTPQTTIGSGYGGPIEATWLVVGSSERQELKDRADLILTGVDDLAQIRDFCTQVSAAGGGRIVLAAITIYQTTNMTFAGSSYWLIEDNVVVEGLGSTATGIQIDSGTTVDVENQGTLRGINFYFEGGV